MKPLIEKNLPEIKNKLKPLGYSISNPMANGEGKYGVAFELPGGKVLKITTDELEAKNNAALKVAKLKHVVQVFRVFALKSFPGVYFSELEKVDPLGSQEKSIMKMYRYYLQNFDVFVKQFKKLPKTLDTIQTDDKDLLESLSLIRKNKNKFTPMSLGVLLHAVKKDVYSGSLLVEEALDAPDFFNQLWESLEEFNKKGLAALDLHSGNAGKKGKILKFFDFGHSSFVPGPKKIEPIDAGLIRKLNKKGYRTLGLQLLKLNKN